MAYQLVYTSSPTSLNRGRSGFSTVARSADMPEKLASAVERLSAYDASSGVVYSHKIITFASARWHILSRTCDSGVDYTNRNNYIAHHLVISDDEISSLANPADVILNWSGWLSSWSGEPRYIDNAENLCSIENSTKPPAKLWAQIFGDASCAALLSSSGACIKASPSNAQTLLNLFSESLSLFVKPAQAWDISFSTYSPTGGDVMWRGVDAQSAVRCVADIQQGKAMTPPSGRLAEYAKSGEMTNREKYNLNVSEYKKPTSSFKVVENTDEPSFAIYYIASAVITLLILISALIYYIS